MVSNACSGVLAAALITVSLFLRVGTVCRDEALPQLNKALRTGPAIGIRTTVEKARLYEDIGEGIRGRVPGEGRAFFSSLLPIGHLCTDHEPYPPSLWRTNLDGGRLKKYRDSNQEKTTGILLVLNEGVGTNPAGNEARPELLRYIFPEGWRQERTEYGAYFRQINK